MVPDFVFDKNWREGNFQIPSNSGLRKELLEKLQIYPHYGITYMPENDAARAEISARIAALEAYNAALAKMKK